MAINQIGNGLYANYIPGQGSAKSNAATAKDMFLRLLVTQMKYKDPTQTSDPTAQISQMASLASMEQLQGLNTNILGLMNMTNTAQSVALIGHDIEGTLSNGAPIQGRVSAVEFKDGIPMLKVGTQFVSLSNITRVTG